VAFEGMILVYTTVLQDEHNGFKNNAPKIQHKILFTESGHCVMLVPSAG
jgi:hypothetical protein